MYCPNCNSEVLTEVKTVSETYPGKRGGDHGYS